jgi:hypothetical protein
MVLCSWDTSDASIVSGEHYRTTYSEYTWDCRVGPELSECRGKLADQGSRGNCLFEATVSREHVDIEIVYYQRG